tara:strand:+ start:2446 stop:3654 length:1209 start_codon:yes stop_codon:yes gene_type:complete
MSNLSNINTLKIFNQKLNNLPEKEKTYNNNLLTDKLASNLLNESTENRTKILESLDENKKNIVKNKLKILLEEKKNQDNKEKYNLYNNISKQLETDVYKINKNKDNTAEYNKISIKNIINKENQIKDKNKLLENSNWFIKKSSNNKYVYTYKNNNIFESDKYHLRKYYKTNNIVLYNKILKKEYNSNELEILIKQKNIIKYLNENGWTVIKKYNRYFYVYQNYEFDSNDYKIYKYKNNYRIYNKKTKKIITLEELQNATLTFTQKIFKTIENIFGMTDSSMYPVNINSFLFLIFTFSLFLYIFENIIIIIVRFLSERLHNVLFHYIEKYDYIDSIIPSEILIINIEDWIPIKYFLPIYILFYIIFTFIFRGYLWYYISYLIISIFLFIGVFRGILRYNGIKI